MLSVHNMSTSPKNWIQKPWKLQANSSLRDQLPTNQAMAKPKSTRHRTSTSLSMWVSFPLRFRAQHCLATTEQPTMEMKAVSRVMVCTAAASWKREVSML